MHAMIDRTNFLNFMGYLLKIWQLHNHSGELAVLSTLFVRTKSFYATNEFWLDGLARARSWTA